VEKLPFDAQGALLSLVFNRGASFTGERRAEMRAIRAELAGGASLARIADQLEAMQRLWPDVRGLRDRRVREAAFCRGARRRYDDGERVDL
jgi:GH24 family phage-related lysozyme (muramidase)